LDIRVAIFEDNKLVRDAYEAILNGTSGFRCTGSFSSCNNIRHDLQRSQPDVALMDIEMTGMNGIEATGIIVKEFPRTRVLIQTVFDDDKRLFACICAGASGYILKDTAPVKLLEAIRDVNSGGASMSPGIAQKVLKLFQTMVPQTQSTREEDDTHLSKREKEIL
jgi:DNA-binding NarL/FixJ family response regulator